MFFIMSCVTINVEVVQLMLNKVNKENYKWSLELNCNKTETTEISNRVGWPGKPWKNPQRSCRAKETTRNKCER